MAAKDKKKTFVVLVIITTFWVCLHYSDMKTTRAIRTRMFSTMQYTRDFIEHEFTREEIGEDSESIQLNAKSFEKDQYFAQRNVTDIQCHIEAIHQLMLPFVIQLENFRDRLKTNRTTMLNISGPLTVINAYNEGYFKKVEHSQVSTILVNLKNVDIMRHFTTEVFDYTANSCDLIEKGSTYGKMGTVLYGARCLPKEKTINPVPFNDIALSVGLPANYVVQQKDHVTMTFIHVINRAIVTPVGDVYVDNLKIVPQRCQQDLTPTVPKNQESIPEEAEVFTIAQYWGHGFFHASIEELPRIAWWLDFLRNNPNVKLHVNSKPGFLTKLLTILQIDERRIITGPVKAEILYMPAGTPCGRAAVQTQLLSMHFRSQIKTVSEPRKSIIVIRRSSKRYFNHHDKIFQMIANLTRNTDIKLELFSDKKLPSLEDTLAMFNRAFLIVGPHGAGESNSLFSEPGTVVIEGLCISQNIANLCYRNLMRALGHRYYGLYPVNRSCKQTKPEHLKEILKYYIETLYLRDN